MRTLAVNNYSTRFNNFKSNENEPKVTEVPLKENPKVLKKNVDNTRIVTIKFVEKNGFSSFTGKIFRYNSKKI